MKKILQVVGALGIGGDTVAIMNMAKSLDKNKFQMDFLSYECYANKYFIDTYRKDGGYVFLLPADVRKMGFLKSFCQTYKFLKRQKYDIVHVHTSFQSSIVLCAAYFAGVKSRICHSHTTMIQRPLPKFLKHIYLPISRMLIKRFATKCVACGSEAGRFLFGKHKFTVLYNGIDLNTFYPPVSDDENNILAEYDTKGKIIIGQVGNIKPMKNQEFSIELCSKISKPYEMFFIGDGVQRQILSEKCKNNTHIHFLGLRSDVAEFMRKFDVLLLPSLPGEGLPVTAIEAQACGCNCIMSESITKEADLGIGLAYYAKLNDVNDWITHISKRPNIDSDVILSAINNKGFNRELSNLKWTKIYYEN